MRIGTWNLAGRWGTEHLALMQLQDCDVWLLTEVNERTRLEGYVAHLGEETIAARRRFAAVFSRLPLDPLGDPHPASAAARCGSFTFVSSILPWRSCRSAPPWSGQGHAAKTAEALRVLVPALRKGELLVWGGDWNHALSGREYAGSIGGRTALLRAIADLELYVPTALLPHRIDGLLSIDHLALPQDIPAINAVRISAAREGQRFSDHDAYVVTI